MSRPILALDGDQILFDWVGGFIAYCLNNGFHLDINSKFDTYNMSPWFVNMSNDQFIDMIKLYNSYEHPKLYPYIMQSGILSRLADKYELCVVSSYSSDKDAVRKRMGILNSLNINNIFLLGIGESKYDTLMEIGNKSGENVFVDDRVEHMLEGKDAGWNVATISYPYNQGVDGVTYMNSLEELL